MINVPLAEDALNGATPYNVRMIKQLDRAAVAGGSSAALEWAAFTASDQIYYNGYRLYFRDQASDAIPFPSSEAPAFMSRAAYAPYVDRTNQQLSDEFGLALGGIVAPASAFDAMPSLGADALAIELVQEPVAPIRVQFGVDQDSNPSHWARGEKDLRIQWRTIGLPTDTAWHLYLDGEHGTTEIGRTGLAGSYGPIVAGPVHNGWQTWEFQWAEVGLLPPQWRDLLHNGEQSLVAATVGENAVYLGRINVAAEASDIVTQDPTAGHHSNPDDSSDQTDHDPSVNDAALEDPQANIPDASSHDTPNPRDPMAPTARRGYRMAVRYDFRPLDAVFADSELLNDVD